MNSVIRVFIFLTLFFTATQAAVWNHSGQAWGPEWEKKYSKWVETSVDEDWLQKPQNPFYKWNIDCAKFAYLLKLYFSYENNLEFAVHNPRASNSVFTSKSSDWDSITDSTQRLKAFARHVLSQVSTRSLPKDSILLPISKEALKPGIILLSGPTRGHTLVLKELSDTGFPTFIFATTPASEFLYFSYAYPAPEVYFTNGETPNRTRAGFRRIKWPQELLKPVEALTSFSFDQEKLSYENFFEEVQSRIQIKPHTTNEKMDYMLDELCMKMRIRVNVIIDSARAQVKQNGRTFSKDEEELYSTYSRDKDILKTIEKLEGYYKQNINSVTDEDVIEKLKTYYKPKWDEDDFCLVQWADNRNQPLGYLKGLFKQQKISSNPNDSFAKRWGEEY